MRFSFCLFAVLLTACNYRIDKTQSGVVPTTWFAMVQANVLNVACLDCHNPQKLSGGIDLSSYDSMMKAGVVKPGAPLASGLYTSIDTKRMPKGGATTVSDDDKVNIYNWILAGASATAPVPTTAPPPPPKDPDPTPTFKYIQTYIFQKHCVSCHQPRPPKNKSAGGLDLRTYDSLIDAGEVNAGNPDGSTLYLKLDSGDMPPAPDSLTKDQIAAVYQWIQDGANQ